MTTEDRLRLSVAVLTTWNVSQMTIYDFSISGNFVILLSFSLLVTRFLLLDTRLFELNTCFLLLDTRLFHSILAFYNSILAFYYSILASI